MKMECLGTIKDLINESLPGNKVASEKALLEVSTRFGTKQTQGEWRGNKAEMPHQAPGIS